MRAMSKRESRLLAILLLLAAAALVDVALIRPLLGGFADRARQRQELLAHYAANDRLIGVIPRLGREAARRDRQLAGFTLSAPDAAAAAEKLRDRLQATATAVDGDFHGGEDIPAPPGMVATRGVLRMSSGQLTRFLALVENARPFVTINALSVSADDALVTGKATTLDVTLEAAIAFHPAPAR
jgi:fermentation-respiration switch protein FrsA (DUF1100 family)